MNTFTYQVFHHLPTIADEFDRVAIEGIALEFEGMGATLEETVEYVMATAYVNDDVKIEDAAIATMKRIREKVERRWKMAKSLAQATFGEAK